MVPFEDYIARTGETCGKDKDVIVTFKRNKKDEAIKKILRKARVEKSISQIVLELTFKIFFQALRERQGDFSKCQG